MREGDAVTVDALVLAGAPNTGFLSGASDEPYEALIRVAGRPMVEYVLAALRATRKVGRIVVVGPVPELQTALAGFPPGVLEFVQSGGAIVENLKRGMERLSPRGRVLMVTSDVPFLSARSVEDFLERTTSRNAALYYPIIHRETAEKRFPGVLRTYVTLKEGAFTGGNVILLEPELIERCEPLIRRAVDARKSAWKLARLLGPLFIVKLALKRLSLADIESKLAKVLGFQGAAVVTDHAEIGVDVDKPCDLELARRLLESP